MCYTLTGDSMKDFFTFYQNIKGMEHPFMAFSIGHMVFVCVIAFVIFMLNRKYQMWSSWQQERFQKKMAIYFLLEEAIYTTWLFLNCHENVWSQVLPLELCSLCVYINVAAVFTRKEYLRFFSAVVGLVAGGVAMLYPANIAGLYPVFSYRVINFYILHGSFILFSIIQLQDRTLLAYHHLRKNTVIICCMFTIAFFVNQQLKTQYMFVGTPPKIGFIALWYEFTGSLFFLPSILLILSILQFLVLYILRKIYRVKQDGYQNQKLPYMQ